jgi:chromosome segregation ATPase
VKIADSPVAMEELEGLTQRQQKRVSELQGVERRLQQENALLLGAMQQEQEQQNAHREDLRQQQSKATDVRDKISEAEEALETILNLKSRLHNTSLAVDERASKLASRNEELEVQHRDVTALLENQINTLQSLAADGTMARVKEFIRNLPQPQPHPEQSSD